MGVAGWRGGTMYGPLPRAAEILAPPLRNNSDNGIDKMF